MRASTARPRGFALAEQLVGLALLAVASAVALLVFGSARRSFEWGDNAAESQQAVRAGLDRLVSDLRAAGLNVRPDDDATRPDEAIEAAYDTAIVVRGDLDGRDPTDARDPEALLEGGAFGTVSTGNDEIAVWALAPDGGGGPDTLLFEADVAEVPRDGVVEVVRVPGVALVHNDPPYTLYRITLDNDAAEFGGRGFLVWTPVADNVVSLRFRYHDGAGDAINDGFDPDRPGDDIGGGDAPGPRALRASVERIEVELSGAARDPDPRTRARRRFSLAVSVSPPNLGLAARRDPGEGR